MEKLEKLVQVLIWIGPNLIEIFHKLGFKLLPAVGWNKPLSCVVYGPQIITNDEDAMAAKKLQVLPRPMITGTQFNRIWFCWRYFCLDSNSDSNCLLNCIYSNLIPTSTFISLSLLWILSLSARFACIQWFGSVGSTSLLQQQNKRPLSDQVEKY